MRFRMTPREDSFFELFAVQSQYLEEGANLLAELIGTPPDQRGVIAEQLHQVEQAADEAAHTIRRRLASVFVTPFDRDAIYELSQRIDDCMDFMDEAGDLILVNASEEFSDLLLQSVELLQRCSELTSQAITLLPRWNELGDTLIEINRVENQASKLLRRYNASVLDDGGDFIDVLKRRDLTRAIENITKCFEAVAQKIEAISVKEH